MLEKLKKVEDFSDILTIADVGACFQSYLFLYKREPFVQELAEELSVKPTKLAELIRLNRKHFEIEETHKGLKILKVYPNMSCKMDTDEWVEVMKEKYKNVIFLEPKLDCPNGTVVYNTLMEELPEYLKQGKRFKEWGNAEEKLERLRKHIRVCQIREKEQKTSYRCFISKKDLEYLRKEGWNILGDYDSIDRPMPFRIVM